MRWSFSLCSSLDSVCTSGFRRQNKDCFEEALEEQVEVLRHLEGPSLLVVEVDEVAGIVPAVRSTSQSLSTTTGTSSAVGSSHSVSFNKAMTWGVSTQFNVSDNESMSSRTAETHSAQAGRGSASGGIV